MIFSMTGYAIATRELTPATVPGGGQHAGSTSVSVELRSVNSRFLDLHFRMPDDVRACEPALREMLMADVARGKVEIRINVQRAEAVSSGGLDHAALTQLAALQEAALAVFPGAARLGMGEMLRWPGVMADSSVAGDVLRAAVLACGREALTGLLATRGREGQALGAVLREHVAAMEAIVADIGPLVPELVARHQQKIVERLREALGVALQEGGTPTIPRDEVIERIRQEVTVYGVRIDIAEELTRLATHLAETRHVLDKGGKVGKRLDFMMQELNREANTVGSKAAAKELADAAMALKLLIEQMREQVQNLE
ncbi:YicC family protein [Robbsia sp. Bb-Pol-6]|uniref:YicC family protein n=1 Tax=Robbsia betulipollinis TaxID=2981849 RepID=A0ABT3ZQC3_9BURK|nr:YicC/YloC family endoribonuclease [Robbsia betulipollinis]MCY0388677.1 YicC family protein [Robbsia betulipollinis]